MDEKLKDILFSVDIIIDNFEGLSDKDEDIDVRTLWFYIGKIYLEFTILIDKINEVVVADDIRLSDKLYKIGEEFNFIPEEIKSLRDEKDNIVWFKLGEIYTIIKNVRNKLDLIANTKGRISKSELKEGMLVKTMDFPGRLWVVLNVTEEDIEKGTNTDEPGLHGFGGMWYGDDPLNKDSYGKIWWFDDDEEIYLVEEDVTKIQIDKLKKLVG